MPPIRNTVIGLKGKGPPGVRPAPAVVPPPAPAPEPPVSGAPEGENPANAPGETEKPPRKLSKVELKAKRHLDTIAPAKAAFEALPKDQKAPKSKTDRTNHTKRDAAIEAVGKALTMVTYARRGERGICTADGCGGEFFLWFKENYYD
ncbi:hypothetical protein GLOTRDRAFT_134247 [Gloeophyllum trabeum ATCC 11539]|uniref:Uncharacterized protein n=1 Tax=Gloeophyllum trabeum (strain ATCC 11539 / FP-39264 / Madison 617) TaxID=670483 RepID=S7R6U8_GLOTA|nr:uncharacterized protein GLOTRDRAFT_134247 [Gloeophyllum trabeum ATCC 11539]EPQ50110.1 hypothetical protein GLOTRDRAFT_134247 [Gloeophyllum trabeum ATCC 11539]